MSLDLLVGRRQFKAFQRVLRSKVPLKHLLELVLKVSLNEPTCF